MDRFVVFGDGRVGRTLTKRLGMSPEWSVDCAGPESWTLQVRQGMDVAVLCVTHGTEAGQVVRELAGAGRAPRLIVDLTTQSVSSAESSASAAGGVRYVAGGLTGGLAGLRGGSAVLLLGGPGLEPSEKAVLAAAGMIIEYPMVRQAVAAKLLHNWYQLASSVALAEAVRVAEALGMSPGGLIAAVHTGPAGRPAPAHSLVRDWLGAPATSYSARLVLKDLSAIADLLGEDCAIAAPVLDHVRKAMEAVAAERGFTGALLAAAGVAPAGHGGDGGQP